MKTLATNYALLQGTSGVQDACNLVTAVTPKLELELVCYFTQRTVTKSSAICPLPSMTVASSSRNSKHTASETRTIKMQEAAVRVRCRPSSHLKACSSRPAAHGRRLGVRATCCQRDSLPSVNNLIAAANNIQPVVPSAKCCDTPRSPSPAEQAVSSGSSCCGSKASCGSHPHKSTGDNSQQKWQLGNGADLAEVIGSLSRQDLLDAFNISSTGEARATAAGERVWTVAEILQGCPEDLIFEDDVGIQVL